MLVAITGGTGFIGSLLVEYHLNHGDHVRVLSRKTEDLGEALSGAEVIRGDLVSGAGIDAFTEDVDVLYHCAGEIRNPDKMYDLHVRGTENLLQASSGRVKHWVQLSSVGVYSPIREGIVTENFPINPVGEYEITKAKSDMLLVEKSKSMGITYSVLRPSNVFGPSMPNKSIFDLIRMVEKGLFFYIGKPGASANYVHVDNVVRALHMCATDPRAKSETFNLSSHVDLETFIHLIADTLGTKRPGVRLPEGMTRLLARIFKIVPSFPLSEARIDAMTLRSKYSIEHIERTLGYKHRKSLEQGIIELAQYWKLQE